MEKQCFIVVDLLSSYMEKLTNDTTNRMIEEHLAECESCQEAYEQLLIKREQASQQEERTSRKFQKKLTRYRYQLIGMFGGIVLTIVVIIGSLVCASFYWKTTSYTDSYTEAIEEYRQFKDYYGISKLSLFPAAKQVGMENAVVEKYIYHCQGNKSFQTCQIYLECKYSEEKYKEEKERVMEISNGETDKSTCYDESNFSYPAVYAMYNSETCYEYVLFLEEEQKMIYIYLQGLVDRRELLFLENYLPLNYGQNGSLNEEETEYSIYPTADSFLEEEW